MASEPKKKRQERRTVFANKKHASDVFLIPYLCYSYGYALGESLVTRNPIITGAAWPAQYLEPALITSAAVDFAELVQFL